MIEIKPMDESYIHINCLHHGPVDPSLPPSRGQQWIDAPDLPGHPWSDETISDLAEKHSGISHGWRGDPAREFMQEMIQRYGTCAILAWDEEKVVGQIRFYPMEIARIITAGSSEPAKHCTNLWEPERDRDTVWVQCIMTCAPYQTPEEAKRVGTRKGVGLKLAQGVISWAREKGWRHIVTVAHSDLDCMYGIAGKGGISFWEKLGFRIVGTCYHEPPEGMDEWRVTVESQARDKGMTKKEAWTWYRMAYEL